jgi:hypothetical protein
MISLLMTSGALAPGTLGIPLRRCSSREAMEPIYGKLSSVRGARRGREPG